jgi:hypothetical protein
LNFTDVNYISTELVRDDFVFKVKSNYSNLFYSEKLEAEINPLWYNLTHPVPPQTEIETGDASWFQYAWLQWLSNSVKTFLVVVFWSCVFASFFLSGRVKNFFKFLRTLQMIMHLPMLRTIIPSCVIYIFSIIIPITRWDFFNDEIVYPNNYKDGDAQEIGIFS